MAASSKEKAKSTLYGRIPKQELLKQCQDILKFPISSPRKSVEGFLFPIRDAAFYRHTCLTLMSPPLVKGKTDPVRRFDQSNGSCCSNGLGCLLCRSRIWYAVLTWFRYPVRMGCLHQTLMEALSPRVERLQKTGAPLQSSDAVLRPGNVCVPSCRPGQGDG